MGGTTYRIKETFYSLQGEGGNAGRPAVFCRVSGCNLWNGREADRLTAVCQFCDTDFVGTDGPGGGKYEAAGLAAALKRLWPVGQGHPCDKRLCVVTGGEPMLQLDQPLVAALHAAGFEVAVETNGTVAVPPSVDWITVSPKRGAEVVQRSGQELKVVFPQDGLDPAAFLDWNFRHFFIQPRDDGTGRWVDAAKRYCLANPAWRLSLQTHKLLGLK